MSPLHIARFGEDFYVIPLWVDPATGQANFRIFINPMFNFIWFGGLIFIIGFFLDFIEITFIHVPVLAPIMIEFGFDPAWFCILIAVNLQTSFMTPPFGFSLFYLKAVTPPEISTGDIYRGIIPFVLFQLIGLLIVVMFPQLVTWLPSVVFR